MNNILLFSYFFRLADLIPYCFFVFFIIVVLMMKKQRQRINGLFIIVLFFSCLRYGIGYDYLTYKDLILGVGDDYSLMAMEPIPKLLISFSHATHFQWFFIITSFLIYTPVFYVIKKKSSSPTLSLWIYIFFPLFFLESLSVVRNHVAFSFVFLSYYFFTEKKYVKTIIAFLIALGFHYSAIIALPIFLLHKFNIKKEFAIALVVVSLFSSAFVLSLVSSISSEIYVLEKFVSYAERSRGGGNLLAIIINIVMVYFFVMWNRLTRVNKANAAYLTFVCVGVAIWNFLGFDYTLRLRLSTYYLFFSLLLIPECRTVIKSKRHRFKPMVMSLCFIIFLLLFVVNIKSNLATHEQLSFLPYRLFFLEQ